MNEGGWEAERRELVFEIAPQLFDCCDTIIHESRKVLSRRSVVDTYHCTSGRQTFLQYAS